METKKPLKHPKPCENREWSQQERNQALRAPQSPPYDCFWPLSSGGQKPWAAPKPTRKMLRQSLVQGTEIWILLQKRQELKVLREMGRIPLKKS